MNNFFQWANKRMDYLSIWDIAGIKWACLSFGVLMACLFPDTLLSLTWKFWLVLSIAFLIKPIHSFYFSNKKIKR